MIDYDQIFLATNRISVEFCDDIGNSKKGAGTGFWIHSNKEKFYFVTNKHILAHKNYKFKLSSLKMYLREQNSIESCPNIFDVNLKDAEILLHPDADVAVLMYQSNLINRNKNYFSIQALDAKNFAQENFFQSSLKPADPCVFIGYPTNKKSDPWWDIKFGLPIARTASFSSHPTIGFNNPSVNSSHARIVEGFSFGGSSGSPVINKGSPIKVGEGLKYEGYVEPKIIGIMAGHWWDENESPEMFRHTGLSYFIASTAIIELINIQNQNK